MSKSLVSTTVTKGQSHTAIGLVDQFTHVLPGMIVLSPGQRRKIPIMGPKSVYFARGVVGSLQQNADIVPRSVDVAGAAAKLESLDALVPVLMAMQQALQRVQDTVDALGSDVMVVASEGYRLMKSLGKAQGLEEITKELSYRHAKRKPTKRKMQPAAASENNVEK